MSNFLRNILISIIQLEAKLVLRKYKPRIIAITGSVGKTATKDAIKKAIKDVYGIKPRRVNVIHTDGKNVRFGRFKGRRSDYKKAIVTLPKGQKIEIHEGV